MPEPLEPPQPRRLLTVATVCGVLPLVAGIGIFVAWWWYRYNSLASAGGYTIFIGLFLFLVGVVCLTRARILARRVSPPPEEDFRRRSITAAAFLFANLPAAALCVFGAAAVRGLPVEIRNESGTPLEDAAITYGTRGPDIRSHVAPGESWHLTLSEPDYNFSTDGPHPTLTARLGDKPLQQVLPNYFQEGRYLVAIRPGGDIEVKMR